MARAVFWRKWFFFTQQPWHTPSSHYTPWHPLTPRDTPQVRRVLVLTLQRPEGCLWRGGGPHAPLRRVRPHHALCAASAAAHSPTDTSPLHSPKESGCGTPAATLPTPAISPRLHPSLTRCAPDGFDSERKLCQSRGVKGATSSASSKCSPWYASYLLVERHHALVHLDRYVCTTTRDSVIRTCLFT